MKKFLKILGLVLCVVLLAVIGLFLWLTVTEYRPQAEETVAVEGAGQPTAFSGDTVRVLSWNLGYCALGEESDFFMDGGSSVRPDSRSVIEKNLSGIQSILDTVDADFYFLQEVDTDSKRCYGIDEKTALLEHSGCAGAYALNYSCSYVPYPLPTIGKVHSGLLTLSKTRISQAQRISLPCPFSWPVSMANLKRCLLVSRVPLEGTEQELVLVNLHLEAYDDGAGKAAQTAQLLDFLQAEYEKGNYVIAGGDFNQTFPDTQSAYPNTHAELWQPNALESESLQPGWQYAYDDRTPTCRLLNQPYDPEDTENTQYYVIDGYILSPNVELEQVKTIDGCFAYSDHNPVYLQLRLVKGETAS